MLVITSESFVADICDMVLSRMALYKFFCSGAKGAMTRSSFFGGMTMSTSDLSLRSMNGVRIYNLAWSHVTIR